MKIGPFVHLAEGFVPTLPKKKRKDLSESDFNENSGGKKTLEIEKKNLKTEKMGHSRKVPFLRTEIKGM